MSSAGRTSKATYAAGIIAAALLAGIFLAACGGNGTGSANLPKSGVAGHKIAPVAIAGFADDPGNPGVQVVVTSPNTLTAGALIVISGTTNYDGTYAVVSSTGTTFTIAKAFVTNDAAGVWQTGGGVIAGCLTTGATGAIALSSVPSRFTGVAPLAVFFDGSATSTTPATPRPFHDLGYGWSFGDAGPSAGNWGIGSRSAGPSASSRNSATGPLAAHVYETPGIYDVTLVITDGTNTVTNACVRIVVQDPDVIFADANTICFSATGTFGDVPPGFCTVPGVTQITTTDFAAALAMAAPGKRLLFRRGVGEIWSAPGGVSVPRLSANGPGIIGAFGTGTALVRPAVAGGNTVLAISGPNSPNIADWRIMDLEFDGLSGLNSNGIVGGGGAQQITFVRMNLHDISNGIQFNAQGLDILPGHFNYDQITIYNSNIQRVIGSGGNGMFLQARRLAVLGNFVEDTRNLADPPNAGEHIIRIQYVSKGVLQANDLGLQAVGKSVLTVRAVKVGIGGVTSPNNTERVVITDNLFRGGAGGGIISVQPSASTNDERISDIIFDGNMIRAGAGTTQTAFITSADEVTVRNNIFNMTGGISYTCMSFARQGVEPAHSEIRVFNNTCFSNDAGVGGPPPTLRIVILDATNSNVTIANNLGYAPNMITAPTLLSNSGSTNITGGSGTFGNSSDAEIKISNPNFVSAGGANASDYEIGVGAGYGVNTGVALPVFTDIFRNVRPLAGSFDKGAAEQ